MLKISKSFLIVKLNYQSKVINYKYMLKVNNRNSRKRCEICSKVTIATPGRCDIVLVSLSWTSNIFQHIVFKGFYCWRRSGVFIHMVSFWCSVWWFYFWLWLVWVHYDYGDLNFTIHAEMVCMNKVTRNLKRKGRFKII